MADKIDMTREDHLNKLNKMATKEFREDLDALLKTRSPLIYITTNEEKRLIEYFRHLASAMGYKIYLWDCFLGILDIITGGKPDDNIADESPDNIVDPKDILKIIHDRRIENRKKAKAMKNNKSKGEIFILLDYYYFLDPLDYDADTERAFKQMARTLCPTSVIITGPKIGFPPSLESEFSVLDFPYPNDEEIEEVLQNLVESVLRQAKDTKKGINIDLKQDREQLIKAAHGLTLREAKMAFSKSVVRDKKLNVQHVLDEKKQIIRKKGYLEYFEPKITIDDVGGLERMIKWFKDRRISLDPSANKYGLEVPRGVLLVGISGCGKSFVSKAVASLYNMPLLRLDFGRLFGSHVGESERSAREAIRLAESMAPSFLWIDELEKAISGMGSSDKSDAGTTSRVIATFLTWMQERELPVFLICTANDPTKLPPELIGRFDETFFVDLPTYDERKQILASLIRRLGRNPKKYNLNILAEKSEYFSGRELEKVIKSSMFVAFSDKKREFTSKDILDMIKDFKPLYLIKKEEFELLRKWADGRCVQASADNIKNKDDHINEDDEMILE